MFRFSKKNSWVFILCFGLLACGEEKKKNPDNTTIDPDVTLEENPYPIQFSSTPPSDLPANATPEQLCTFAWEEFFALNWKSSYESDQKRDNPDASWNYESTSDPNPSLLVWETYAHRAEYRPASGVLEDFNNAPHYDFNDQSSFVAVDDASFGLFNNLDENNEIGSCYVFGQTDTYGTENLVLYQAKCNSDQYNYIKDNYADAAAVSAAQKATADSIKKLKNYYPGATSTCDCPPGIFCLPCDNSSGQTGAIEIKTAWRQLKPQDDATRFITRTVIDYAQDSSASGTFYRNKVYALIGIHIIRKTQNHNNFVFATFEQVDVEKASMGYQEIEGSDVGPLVSDFPRYSRLPLPPAEATASTAAAHKALLAKNPSSLLQYYRLTGVQGTPQTLTAAGDSVVADSNSFSFYLANYVIESDPGLGDFQGTFGEPHSQKINELFQGNFISGGGCQGCHGSAQMGGSDFSFISASPSFEPDVHVSRVPAGTSTKIDALIKRFNK